MASMTIRIDPDMLWRCFCLHNVHSGAVTNPFHMNYYNFLSLLQKVDLPKSARLSNAQLGVIFRSVAYQTTAEIRKHKSMRTRIYEQSCNHKGNDVKRTSTHGNKLSYCAFLHALTKCAMAVYPQEPNHKQALGMFVYHYILAKQVREQNPVIHLPYDVHVDSAELFLQDEQVVLFFQQYGNKVDAMFMYYHLRGHRVRESNFVVNQATDSKKQMMSYTEFIEFVDTHCWFSKTAPNLLSKADIAKIFFAVKNGGGTGQHPNQIDNTEFKTCLVLLALCGTKACAVLPPIVHTISDSRSSSSLSSSDVTNYLHNGKVLLVCCVCCVCVCLLMSSSFFSFTDATTNHHTRPNNTRGRRPRTTRGQIKMVVSSNV